MVTEFDNTTGLYKTESNSGCVIKADGSLGDSSCKSVSTGVTAIPTYQTFVTKKAICNYSFKFQLFFINKIFKFNYNLIKHLVNKLQIHAAQELCVHWTPHQAVPSVVARSTKQATLK